MGFFASVLPDIVGYPIIWNSLKKRDQHGIELVNII